MIIVFYSNMGSGKTNIRFAHENDSDGIELEVTRNNDYVPYNAFNLDVDELEKLKNYLNK